MLIEIEIQDIINTVDNDGRTPLHYAKTKRKW